MRSSTIKDFEREAEVLVVYHLDLLAEMESALRAVHGTLRRIHSLRGKEFRSGRELNDGERQSTLTGLSDELTEIDRSLHDEHECCANMQQTIKKMQLHLGKLKRLATKVHNLTEGAEDEESPSPGG